jgi:hypothetical protein
MMDKCIWMVDDHPNRPTIERLKMVGTIATPVVVKDYCGTGMAVAFIKEMAMYKPQPNNYFILDCYMPIPGKIKASAYWQEQPEDARYCGFALAKWLNAEKAIPFNHILLCSAFQDFAQKKTDFGLGTDPKCWDGWQTMTVLNVRKWLGI